MIAVLCSLLLTPLASASPADASAAEIRFTGTVSPLSRGAADAPEKRFTVYITSLGGKTRELAFLVEENGAGGWPWPERFGLLTIDENNRPTNKTRIRLLYTYQGTPYPIEVPNPFFEQADKLKSARTGMTWKDGKRTYEVVRDRTVAGRDCWQIDVSDRLGHRGTLLVEKTSRLLVSARRRVFVGRGERFLLEIDLDSFDPVGAERFARLEKPVRTLATLQSELKRSDSQQKKPELTEAQLQAASALLQRLTRQASGTPFADFVATVARDVNSQLQRSDDVARLAKKFVGSAAPELRLKTIEGEMIDPADLAGNIVLLHFWEYRSEPLEEPYGQVGYLDFLNSQMKKRRLRVRVYGVAVDERLNDARKAAAARRSVRELKNFFNLGYPVVEDDGTLLRKFGDPRRFDAKLPLWVLVGADGKIVHYHTGFYEIDPNEGLQQLEGLIVDLVKRGRK